MQKFSYMGSQQIRIAISQLFGALGLFFFTAFTFFTITLGVSEIQADSSTFLNDPRVTLFCFMSVFLIVTWVVCSTLINFLPTIWLGEEELIISAYIFFRIRISWSNIIDIGAGIPPRGYILVRARRITPFHRVYGWLYSQTLYPSFLIGKDISDRNILIENIKRRTKGT